MRTQSLDTHPRVEAVQIALLRRASIARRLSCLRSLSRSVVGLARRALSRTRPELNEYEIAALFVENHYGIIPANSLKNAIARKQPMSEQNILTALKPVIEAFGQLGVPHYVGGSVASSAYGIPRATLDVDIVADLKPNQVRGLVAMLESAYYVDEDMIMDAIGRGGTFNLIHLDSMLKVDVFVAGDGAYQREALQRRRKDTLTEEPNGVECYLASAEDIVLNKLNWFRLGGGISEQQWRDILGVLKVQADALDVPYLRRWASELRLLDLLERALEEAGLSARPDTPASP